MSTIKASILRPGYLVSLSTSIRGGCDYMRKDLETGLTMDELKAQAEAKGTPVPDVRRWETTATVSDPADYKAATEARNKAASLVRRVCACSSGFLLCPEDKADALREAMTQASAIVAAHNAIATTTRVSVYVIPCRMAGSDEIAAQAIISETRDVIEEMNRGIDALDPEAIRKAATRAQNLGQALLPEQAERVGAAVKAAREAATRIKRVASDGMPAADILAGIQRGAIENARAVFADLDMEPAAMEGPAMPAVDLQRFDLDASPEVAPVAEVAAHVAPSIDLDDSSDAPSTSREDTTATGETLAASPYGTIDLGAF